MLKDYKKIQIHSGQFHLDDLMCVYLAKSANPDIEIIRGGTPIYDNPEVLLCDYGDDARTGKHTKFDHHNKDFAEYDENGIQLAACGLLFKEYGEELFPNEEIRNRIENQIISGINAIDNGYFDMTPNFGSSLAMIIGNENPFWDENIESDKKFQDALSIMTTMVDRQIEMIKSSVKALDIIKEAYETSSNKEIIELEQFVPAIEYYRDNTDDVKFITFPSNRGGFAIQAIPPDKDHLKDQRCTIPQTAVELSDVTFVHAAGFFASAKTQSAAKAVAEYAINKNKEINMINLPLSITGTPSEGIGLIK